MNILPHAVNRFNGIEINTDELPDDAAVFEQELSASLVKWVQDGRFLIWLHLPIERAALIPVSTAAGFVFHHTEPNYVLLVRKMQETPSFPATPRTTSARAALSSTNVANCWSSPSGIAVQRGPITSCPAAGSTPVSIWRRPRYGKSTRRPVWRPGSRRWFVGGTGTATATASRTSTSSAGCHR